MDIVCTFLGAHIAPQDGRSAAAFVDVVKNEMLPAVLAQGIAESQDLSCENGDFSAAQAKELIDVSQALGLPVRVHGQTTSWVVSPSGTGLGSTRLRSS